MVISKFGLKVHKSLKMSYKDNASSKYDNRTPNYDILETWYWNDVEQQTIMLCMY